MEYNYEKLEVYKLAKNYVKVENLKSLEAGIEKLFFKLQALKKSLHPNDSNASPDSNVSNDSNFHA